LYASWTQAGIQVGLRLTLVVVEAPHGVTPKTIFNLNRYYIHDATS